MTYFLIIIHFSNNWITIQQITSLKNQFKNNMKKKLESMQEQDYHTSIKNKLCRINSGN